MSTFTIFTLLLLLSIASTGANGQQKPATCTTRCPFRQRCVNGKCVDPCRKACTFPSCKASAKIWTEAMNRPCWQTESDQITGSTFMRTSCKCPSRDFENSINQADLSNCIERTISGTSPSFRQARNIAVWRISGEFNINFLKKAIGNRFCQLISSEDIEITFNATFIHNFIGTLHAPDTLALFPGVRFLKNRVVQTNVGRLSAFGAEGFSAVVIAANRFGHIVARNCDDDFGGLPAAVRIKRNFCGSANVEQTNTCTKWDAGFSCAF